MPTERVSAHGAAGADLGAEHGPAPGLDGGQVDNHAAPKRLLVQLLVLCTPRLALGDLVKLNLLLKVRKLAWTVRNVGILKTFIFSADLFLIINITRRMPSPRSMTVSG